MLFHSSLYIALFVVLFILSIPAPVRSYDPAELISAVRRTRGFVSQGSSSSDSDSGSDSSLNSAGDDDQDIPELYFPNRVDQFSTSSRQYQHRYFMNNKFWSRTNPDSPILVSVGCEAPIDSQYLTEATNLYFHAKQFQGLMFIVEHRYYGKSWPTEIKPVLATAKDMKYLNSHQAVNDLLSFKRFAIKKYNIPSTAKWILYGASYCATLAAYARAEFPWEFHGALTSSPPLVAVPGFELFYPHVLASYPDKCRTTILSALKDFPTTVDRMNQLALYLKTSKFTPTTFDSPTTRSALGFWMYTSLSTPVMLNDMVDFNISILCQSLSSNMKLTKQQPLYSLIKTLQDGKRLSLPIPTSVASIGQGVTTKMESFSWQWQICGEFGYDHLMQSDKPGSIPIEQSWFYPLNTSMIPLYQQIRNDLSPILPLTRQFSSQICQFLFELSPNQLLKTIESTNQRIGGLKRYESLSRLFVFNGALDPWSLVSLQSTHGKDSYVIVCSDCAHTTDILSPYNGESKELAPIREKQIEYLKRWLAAPVDPKPVSSVKKPVVKRVNSASSPVKSVSNTRRMRSESSELAAELDQANDHTEDFVSSPSQPLPQSADVHIEIDIE